MCLHGGNADRLMAARVVAQLREQVAAAIAELEKLERGLEVAKENAAKMASSGKGFKVSKAMSAVATGIGGGLGVAGAVTSLACPVASGPINLASTVVMTASGVTDIALRLIEKADMDKVRATMQQLVSAYNESMKQAADEIEIILADGEEGEGESVVDEDTKRKLMAAIREMPEMVRTKDPEAWKKMFSWLSDLLTNFCEKAGKVSGPLNMLRQVFPTLALGKVGAAVQDTIDALLKGDFSAVACDVRGFLMTNVFAFAMSSFAAGYGFYKFYCVIFRDWNDTPPTVQAVMSVLDQVETEKDKKANALKSLQLLENDLRREDEEEDKDGGKWEEEIQRRVEEEVQKRLKDIMSGRNTPDC